MRPWISLLLGAGLLAAIAAPSTAGTMTPRSPVLVAGGHVEAPFHRQRFFHRHAGFGQLVFAAPLVFPGGYYGSDIGPGMPPVIMLSEAPVAAPPPPLAAVDQRPSVETTADGMVIVRGPGSRHIR